MDFDNQTIIPIIFAFSLFISLLPMLLLRKIKLKLCFNLFLLGLILIPINAAWLTRLNDVTFLEAITFNVKVGARGLISAYYLTIVGALLSIIALLQKALTRRSS